MELYLQFFSGFYNNNLRAETEMSSSSTTTVTGNLIWQCGTTREAVD